MGNNMAATIAAYSRASGPIRSTLRLENTCHNKKKMKTQERERVELLLVKVRQKADESTKAVENQSVGGN